jgi:hypothetical protein
LKPYSTFLSMHLLRAWKFAIGAAMTILFRRLSIFAILIFGVALVGADAQVQATNGSIQGEVVDAGGAVVPGAAVEANNIDTSTVRQAVTDGSGHFDFLSLQPGRYEVKVSKTGFAETVQQNLTLLIGHTISLRLTLQVAGASTSIIVSSEPPVDVVTASSTTTLGEQTIATTPVLGRKFEDLLTMTPGVSISQGPDATRSTSTASVASSTTSAWMAATTTTGSSASSPAVSARRWISRWKQ